MIEPLTMLSITMHAKKGSYALLLGSGVSRASRIPTGWEVVLDLIRRVAKCHGEDPGEAPDEWYRSKYGLEPEYSPLLDSLTQTQAERSQLLRGYIEPDETERDLGLKLPTDAHRSIAEMVSGGYIRVIVTTNFDRLLELALADVGVIPTVIDSNDSVGGALPLVHNDCTIIKLNGDYIDARIRNTSKELESYPTALNRLLNQVLREYGLVVCGWSGDWDTALVRALHRTRSQWFGTYWAMPGLPRPAAQTMIDHRHAKVITDMDADRFFRDLSDRITALERMGGSQRLSTTLMKETVKRYLDDPGQRIRLHDLIAAEAQRVRNAVESETLPFYNAEFALESVEARLAYYEKMSEAVRELLATGCYWGHEEQYPHWKMVVERLSGLSRVDHPSFEDWVKLRYYPALLGLYASGLSCVAREDYALLRILLEDSTATYHVTGERLPLLSVVNTEMMTEYVAQLLAPNMIARSVLPLRLRNTEGLWDTLKEYVPEDDKREALFDRFEYLMGMCSVDVRLQHGGLAWGPVGYLPWRHHGTAFERLRGLIDQEVEQLGESWPPLRAGLFGGSLDRLQRAKQPFDVLVSRSRYS